VPQYVHGAGPVRAPTGGSVTRSTRSGGEAPRPSRYPEGVTSTILTYARRTTVLVAASTAPLVLGAPARADVPEGWSDPPTVSVLESLVLLVGVPLGLFVLIALAVYVPALARGERVAPGAPEVEDRWFGGPRQGTRELEAGGDPGQTGGASGRW
jgi:hypothetical protein